MNLTKRLLLSFCIISFGINLVGSSMAQTSSQVLSQTDEELNDKLIEASERGDEESIRELIAMGANISAQDWHGSTAFHLVAYEDHVGCIKVLVDLGANIEARNNYGFTALHSAAWGRSVESIKVLVGLGANIEAQDRNGWTALHRAVDNGDAKCIKVLVDLGGSIDAQDNDGFTAFHFAAGWGKVECIKMLVNLRANVDAQASNGCTALHHAADGGHVESIKVLVDLGANIEAQDYDGCTALHWAAIGSVECMKVLLELRANPSVRDNNQRTALDLAFLLGRKDSSKVVVKLSYLLLHPPEGNLLSARNRASASLWALSHGPVTEDAQAGERRIGLPVYPRLWVLLSDNDSLMCKAVVFIFLTALRNGTSRKLNLLANAKAATVKYLLEELKKRFAYLRTLPDIEPDRAKLLDPDSVIINIESDVLAGINERIDELNERIQDDTVSSSSAVSLSSERKARLS